MVTAMARASDILALARAELGVKEFPANSNIVKYSRWYGLTGAWCVMFVQWVFAQADASLLPVRTASCTALMNAAKKAGCWVTSGYQPGDVVIYDWGGDKRPDHCGIVERAYDEGVIAIEGNTAVGNDSNGGEVMRRTRANKYILGAVRPVYETEDNMDIDIENLTEEQLVRLAERMQAALAKRPVSDTLSTEFEKAKNLGITDGSNPNAFCTKAQAAVMVKRAATP